jgi:hypothetical protein
MPRNYLITITQLSPAEEKYLLAVTKDDADIVHLSQFDRVDLVVRRVDYLKRQYPNAQTLWLGGDPLPAAG